MSTVLFHRISGQFLNALPLIAHFRDLKTRKILGWFQEDESHHSSGQYAYALLLEFGGGHLAQWHFLLMMQCVWYEVLRQTNSHLNLSH